METDLTRLEDELQDLNSNFEELRKALGRHFSSLSRSPEPVVNVTTPAPVVTVEAMSAPVTLPAPIINPQQQCVWTFEVLERDREGKIKKFRATPLK